MQQFAELWYADHTCIFQNNSSFFFLASFLDPDPVLDPNPEYSFKVGSGSGTNHSRSTTLFSAFVPWKCLNYRICRKHIWIVDSTGVLKNAGTGKVTSYEEQADNVHTLYSAIDQDSGSGVTPFWTEVLQTDTYVPCSYHTEQCLKIKETVLKLLKVNFLITTKTRTRRYQKNSPTIIFDYLLSQLTIPNVPVCATTVTHRKPD